MQALKTDVLPISGFIWLYSIKTRDKRISFNYPQVYSINPFNVFQGKTIFSSRRNKKCCLVTCYPPVFSIHHFSFLTERSIHSPLFQIRIDHSRSAYPLKAFKGIADSVWSLPPSLFLFFSLSKDYIGRIYTYIYISRTIYSKLGNGNKATSHLLLNRKISEDEYIFFAGNR